MANQRTFQAQALVLNGVAAGGLASMSFEARFTPLESTPDGAIGTEDVDRHSLDVNVNIQCTDVAKVNAILDAAVGNTTFSGKESGATTWHNYTVAGIVITGCSLDLRKGADATLGLTGKVRFATPAADLDEVILLTGAVGTPPTLTYPARLYRPNTASFDPDGAPAAIAPIHVESVALALAANVISDSNDADVGMTAVDIAGWRSLQTTLVYRDAKAVSPSHITAQLLAAVRGNLTVSLLGRGGAANKVLTVNNCLWTGANQREGAEYAEFTLRGNSGWKNAATVYTLNGTPKLFDIA